MTCSSGTGRCRGGHCWQSGGRNSKPAIKQPPIDSRLRALNRHRANGFRVVGGRACAADDGIAEALLPHGLEAGEQQARADAAFSRLGRNPGRAKEIATRRVMASNSNDPALLDRNEAGDGLAREGDLSLAGPALGKILPHPRGDFVFLRSKSAPNVNPLFAQSCQRRTGVGQVIELYEHVHGSGFTLAITIAIAALLIPSVPRSTCCARFLWDVARVASVLGQHLVSGVKSVSRPGVPSNRPDYREPICLSGVRNSIASTAVYGYTVTSQRLASGPGRASIR